MYESLTKYLPYLSNDEIGELIVDQKNAGTVEHLKQMPYVNYSKIIDLFTIDVHLFLNAHKEMGLNFYQNILESNGIKWNMESMISQEIENLDAKCILALIIAVIRADRICEGTLFCFFANGSIIRWLERLQVLDIENQ